MTLARLVALAAVHATSLLAAARAHEHETPAGCECAVCVAVPTTKKSSTYEYETKGVAKCYVKARCDLFRWFHHEPSTPTQAVPMRRRVLMKREVKKEEATVKYEARTLAVPSPAHNLERCRACHGG